MESYKWIYNLVVLNLYLHTVEVLKSTENSDPSDHSDPVIELKTKLRELQGKLDPSIRHHLQKRGVSVKQNTYIGFDTEFTTKDLETNTLVSAQLAVTTKTYIHLPFLKPYHISKIDENTGKIVNLKSSSSVFNYSKIETSVQMCIRRIRQIKYENYDGNITVLNETLKLIKGLSYMQQDDQTVFSLPRSLIQPYLHIGTSFSFKSLLQIASGLAKESHNKSYSIFLHLIQEITKHQFSLQDNEKLGYEIFSIFGCYEGVEMLGVGFEDSLSILPTEVEINSDINFDIDEKRLSREFCTSLFPQKLSITKTQFYYIIAHLTPADLSMLSDFEEVKEDLTIVNGSFVSLGQPLKFNGKNIHIRDTMLLAPGGSKSLASIGNLYGDVLNKIVISKEDLEDMQGFLNRDRVKFIEYALRDAIISLIHASWMEDFNFQNGGIGIPISLSSLGRSYVKSIWREESYPGYQISQKYLLGDVATTITPKGLNVNKIGFLLPYYIANYKGGRNECFMYGIDRDRVWFDYDLISAYTTVMSVAGHPDYNNCRRITVTELRKMPKTEILFSYLILNADFEFPSETKYPSIPCYVDENCTIYPLKGTCILTGAEYILALTQGCKLTIHDIYLIPFAKSEYKEYKPFSSTIKLVQEKRREYKKGTISNLMFKEIGNSIYGSVVRGIGNKRKFDIKSGGTIRMTGDDLSNPLIASWTTAFIRSIIGECLHSIQKLGGLVVSVTTDGFVTNIDGFEDKIYKNFLMGEFKNIRTSLSDDNSGLELKSEGKGILVWSTRGQLGMESKIVATTGFQHRVYRSKDELVVGLLETFKTESKTIEYVQTRLRSASDIYKKGGHVTMLHKDQLFRMHFDNRRVLEWEVTIPHSIEFLVDSKPLVDITHGQNIRFIGRMGKNKPFLKYSRVDKTMQLYKNKEGLVIRNFLKALLSSPAKYNLSMELFYGYNDLAEFINTYQPAQRLTAVSISNLKRKVSEVKWLPVSRTKESEEFIQYILGKFKDFDVESFFNGR